MFLSEKANLAGAALFEGFTDAFSECALAWRRGTPHHKSPKRYKKCFQFNPHLFTSRNSIKMSGTVLVLVLLMSTIWSDFIVIAVLPPASYRQHNHLNSSELSAYCHLFEEQ